jgi:hypothetical protein
LLKDLNLDFEHILRDIQQIYDLSDEVESQEQVTPNARWGNWPNSYRLQTDVMTCPSPERSHGWQSSASARTLLGALCLAYATGTLVGVRCWVCAWACQLGW